MNSKKHRKTVQKLMADFKRIRKEKGLSHEKLAEITGLNRSTISLLESGERIPTILTCLRIAEGLGVELKDLL